MKSYFSQFGEIKHIILSRSRKTGRSKGYAHLQFEDATVAKIAAETMNGYPLMDKVIVAAVVAPEKVNEDLFRHADRKWKKVPWRKVIRGLQTRPKSEEGVARQVKSLVGAEAKSALKLAAAGIDYALSTTYASLAVQQGLLVEGGESSHGVWFTGGAAGEEIEEEVAVSTKRRKVGVTAAPVAAGRQPIFRAGSAGAKSAPAAAPAAAPAKSVAVAAVAPMAPAASGKRKRDDAVAPAPAKAAGAGGQPSPATRVSYGGEEASAVAPRGAPRAGSTLASAAATMKAARPEVGAKASPKPAAAAAQRNGGSSGKKAASRPLLQLPGRKKA
jgi:nucleolar protein 15